MCGGHISSPVRASVGVERPTLEVPISKALKFHPSPTPTPIPADPGGSVGTVHTRYPPEGKPHTAGEVGEPGGPEGRELSSVRGWEDMRYLSKSARKTGRYTMVTPFR